MHRIDVDATVNRLVDELRADIVLVNAARAAIEQLAMGGRAAPTKSVTSSVGL